MPLWSWGNGYGCKWLGIHTRIGLHRIFCWNKEFAVHMHSYYCTLEVSGMHNSCQILLCLKVTSAELLIERYAEIIKLFPLEFPYFHHGRSEWERKRSVLALLQRLLCSLPEAVWPRFVCDAQIISQLHKDPEAEGGDPSKGPVMSTHTLVHSLSLSQTHTRTHTLLLLGGMAYYSHSQEWGLSG